MLFRRPGRPLGPIASLCCTLSCALVALVSLAAREAAAFVVDFESLAHGEVALGSLAGTGLTIDALNPNRGFDLAVGFDTRLQGTADLDLQASPTGPVWSAGNLANTALGVILILQENDAGCSTGICSSPDDEGRRPAGDLILDFETPLLELGFDLIDIDSLTSESGSIELFDGTSSVTIDLLEFLDPGSPFYDPTIELGNNSANRFAPISAAAVGLEKIDAATFHLGGSGGLDNVSGTLVPEPTTALLMALGLGGLGVAARRTAARS